MTTKVKYQTGLEKFNRINPGTNVLFNFIFSILALMCVVPVLFVLMISLTSERALENGYQFIPKKFSFEAYKFLAQQGHLIFPALGISVFVTVVGTVIGVILTTTLGYVLSRREYKLKKLLTWMVFIPMVFNGGMVSSYYINTNLLHLKDSVWALILPIAVSSFNVIICRTYFRTTIPDSVIESAKIDGASQLRIYFRIVLPLSLPVLATIGLFLCFGYWNDWFQSMLYIDNQRMYSLQALLNMTMQNVEYLSKNRAFMGVEAAQLVANLPKEGSRMAIAILIILPIACAYPFFQKYFISGLTVGSVKE